MENTHILHHTVTKFPVIPRSNHQDLNCTVARSNRFVAYRYKKNLVVTSGFCIALLPGKPQARLIFAVAAQIWALRNNRAVSGISVLVGARLVGREHNHSAAMADRIVASCASVSPTSHSCLAVATGTRVAALFATSFLVCNRCHSTSNELSNQRPLFEFASTGRLDGDQWLARFGGCQLLMVCYFNIRKSPSPVYPLAYGSFAKLYLRHSLFVRKVKGISKQGRDQSGAGRPE